MSDCYIGFRVEIANKMATKNLIKQFNSTHTKTKLFDLHNDGKVAVEKKDGLITVKGIKLEKISTGLANFSVMTLMKNKDEVIRLIQIINVLGNDRLIREKVQTFISGHSILNSIPELSELKEALKDLETLIPGFAKLAWYYAPEAIF